MNLRRFLLPVIAVVFVIAASCQRAVPRPFVNQNTRDDASEFLKNPTSQGWQQLNSGKPMAGSAMSQAAAHIFSYNGARNQRDLPNSMIRNGRVAEYIRQQESIMRTEFDLIARTPTDSLWVVLRALCQQSFDEDLVWTSAELAFRLSPDHYGAFVQTLHVSEANLRILDEVRERFISGGGHISDDW